MKAMARPVSFSKKWQSTQHSNIAKPIPSGVYYARFRVKGKLIWRSLKIDVISIFKLRSDGVKKAERKKSEAGLVQVKDRILILNCIEAHRQKRVPAQ